ncbi:MAG: nitroreductase family protein [Burkholderiales bacterium]
MKPQKPAHTLQPIHELLANRWSPRAFDAGKTISREQIIAMIEAARWAPSCFGDDPWRFIVWDKSTDQTNWEKAFDCIGESNQKWVKNAPLLFVSIANTLFDHNSQPNRWGQYDTGAASMALVLQAGALGLVSHQMGGFDAAKLRASFSIPDQFVPMAMIAVGYQADADILEGDYLTRELAPRKRKPIEARYFEGAWGEPVKTQD